MVMMMMLMWLRLGLLQLTQSATLVGAVVAMVADVTATRTARETQAALAAQRQLALDAARLGWWQYAPATGEIIHAARFAQIYGIGGAGVTSDALRDAMARLIYTGVTGRTPPSQS